MLEEKIVLFYRLNGAYTRKKNINYIITHILMYTCRRREPFPICIIIITFIRAARARSKRVYSKAMLNWDWLYTRVRIYYYKRRVRSTFRAWWETFDWCEVYDNNNNENITILFKPRIFYREHTCFTADSCVRITIQIIIMYMLFTVGRPYFNNNNNIIRANSFRKGVKYYTQTRVHNIIWWWSSSYIVCH